MLLRSLAAAVLTALAVIAPAAGAAPAPVDPVPYFSNARYSGVSISPSGRYLAALTPAANGRKGVAVMALATREPKVVAVIDDYDIGSITWVNDDYLVFSVYDSQSGLGEQRGGGLFAVDREGKNVRMLSPTVKMAINAGVFRYHGMRLIGVMRDGSNDIFVAISDRSPDHPDAYRINVATGRKTLESIDMPGNAIDYVFDQKGVLRAVVTDEKSMITKSWWRASADAKWEQIGEYNLRDAKTYPVAFDADGTLIVTSNAGRDTYALYRWDPVKKALGEPVAAYPRADFEGGLVFDMRTRKLVGMRYDVEKAGTVWFDDEYARAQATVDKALPDTVNSISRGEANVYLVTAFSDRQPGQWYLFDADKGKLEFLGDARKAIDPAKMPARKAVRYKARDGLEIPGFLTLPPGREAKNLPLIMLVHGGPNVRGTHWQWNPEAAYLAALGYAVLEPDFRGSMGWGTKLFQAGWKQWGRGMQDDLNDGMDWLVGQGIVDPKRACIAGASYGGYAVMEGLARDPDRWRCGINYVGVTDIELMFTVTWSDFAYSDYLKYAAKEIMGDPDKDAALLKSVSPLQNAAKIKAPVLMVYGGADVRVPVIHGEKMRDALKANGTPVEWTVYPEEGHGFLLEKNRYDFYRQVQDFLGRYLPAYP